MDVGFQFVPLRRAHFTKQPNLTWLQGRRRPGNSHSSHMALLERWLRRTGICLIIMLFLPLTCLMVSSQVYGDIAVTSDHRAAIFDDQLRAGEIPDQPQGGLRELPELVVQSGHSGSIIAMAFSGDEFLATASTDGTVKMWYVDTGQLLQTLKVSEYWVFSVSYSPDGKLLATGSGDNVVRIWETTTGRQIKVLAGNAHAVNALAFSADGKRLAAGSDVYEPNTQNNLISVWEIDSGNRLFQVDRVGEVHGLAFSGSNRLVVSVGGDVNTWDLDNDRPVKAPGLTVGLSPYKQYLKAGTVKVTSADGRWTAVARGASFDLSDQVSKVEAKQPRPLAVRAISVSPDGELIAVGHTDGSLTMWDTKSGQPVSTFQGQEPNENNIIHSVGFTPDGNNVIGANWNSGIWMWNLSRSGSPREVHRALAVKVGKYLSSGYRMHAEVNPPPAPPGPIMNFRVSVDGDQPSPMTEEVFAATVAPTGRLMAYGGYSWNNLTSATFFSIIDWETLQKVDDYVYEWGTRIEPGDLGEITALSFSSTGETLAIGGRNGVVRIRDVRNNRFVYLQNDNSGVPNALAFSPNGRLLASAGTDKSVKLWDLSSKKFRSLEGHSAPVLCVTFSRDGTRLISGGADSQIIVWDPDTGQRLQTIATHSTGVNALAFSPNGNLLVSGSEDGTLGFWSGSPFELLATAVSFGVNEWMVFSPEGFFDGTQQAWQLAPFRFSSEPRLYQPEQFFNEFYQPNLLADVLASQKPLPEILREQGDPRASIDVSVYRNSFLPNLFIIQPPTGNVSTQRIIDITIEAHDTGSGLRDLRVFRNQSLVHLEHGELHADPLTKTFRIVVPVKIVAGENTISAYVFNRDNIKSKDATIAVTGARTLERRGKAYILAIGINQYSNPGFDLHFARADAQAFGDALGRSLQQIKASDQIAPQVVPVVLFDTAASKRNITAALRRLAGIDSILAPDLPSDIQALEPAEPEDSVFIYFAGHGAARGDRYYLLPHDLGYEGDSGHIDMNSRLTILKNSLSDLDLERVLEKIDSPRILLIIDACQSGQILEAEEKRRGPMNSRGLAQLAYEKGAYILAAAESYQAALEFKKLGHGILTYVLVEEGLNKYAADFAPQDGRITPRKWLQYATRQVPSEIRSMEKDHLRDFGRGVDYGEIAITGQAPRSYFRRETDESWVLATAPSPSAPK
jgi:WD40 repeat protein/uncharacterized caspase-like protein